MNLQYQVTISTGTLKNKGSKEGIVVTYAVVFKYKRPSGDLTICQIGDLAIRRHDNRPNRRLLVQGVNYNRALWYKFMTIRRKRKQCKPVISNGLYRQIKKQIMIKTANYLNLFNNFNI